MSGWKGEKERGALWAMRFMRWLCRHRLDGLIQILLYPIVGYFYLSSRKVRLAAKDYFLHVQGSYSGLDHYKQLLCFARSLVDRVLLLMGETDGFIVHPEGREVLIEARDKGQGLILLGAHLGSFEAGRALVKNEAGLDIHIVAYHAQSKKVREILDDANPEMLKKIIDPSHQDAVFRMREVIESGGILAILSDRVGFGAKTVPVQFMGDSIEMPSGAYMLASVLRCPVFCFFAMRIGSYEYQSYTLKLADQVILDRKDRDKSLMAYAQSYADLLETYAKRYKYHWFNFYDYWGKLK